MLPLFIVLITNNDRYTMKFLTTGHLEGAIFCPVMGRVPLLEVDFICIWVKPVIRRIRL